jgi:hypothetical protein
MASKTTVSRKVVQFPVYFQHIEKVDITKQAASRQKKISATSAVLTYFEMIYQGGFYLFTDSP